MDLDKIQGLTPEARKALEKHCLEIGEPLGPEEVKEEAKKEVKEKTTSNRRKK